MVKISAQPFDKRFRPTFLPLEDFRMVGLTLTYYITQRC